jgi:hypothetical protein
MKPEPAHAPDTRECPEAIHSQGSACKKCTISCYRQGWTQSQVRADSIERGKMGKGAV